MSKVMYNGWLLSLNEVNSLHWRDYQKAKKAVELEMLVTIQNAGLPKYNVIGLEVKFNSGHDVDNLPYMSKIFVDTLVRCGKLPDDNKKNYKKVSFEYCPELPRGTIEFKIYDWI